MRTHFQRLCQVRASPPFCTLHHLNLNVCPLFLPTSNPKPLKKNLTTLLFLRLRMLVNLNSSTQVELMHLPHVAEARSCRIWLKEGGGFKSSDDFCSRGIGFGGKGILWAEISQFVSFGPESKRYNESKSMKYDRIMAARLARQRIYEMPEGPGHPWGATWTR